MRYFVTGTDTGVGKTRVTAALARALSDRNRALAGVREVAIVKLVQTGLVDGEPGDAAAASTLAGVAARELHRFLEPADPWTAALAASCAPLRAATLVAEVLALEADGLARGCATSDFVLEGSGGIAVPLNADETLADVAVHLDARAIIVVGLRLGCINHTVLTLEYLAHRGIEVAAIAYAAPWAPVDAVYVAQVERAVTAKTPEDRIPARIYLPFDPDAERSVAAAAAGVAFLS